MPINDALACGNAPRSSVAHSGLVGRLTRKFEQELGDLAGETTSETMTPVRFRGFLGSLCKVLMATGRRAVERVLEEMDEPRAYVGANGRRLRYRGTATRQWLSPFGQLAIQRRTYRGNAPDPGSRVPLDEACGMAGSFMTPDVEEMAVFGAAMLTAEEGQEPLGKSLPMAPSPTAIQNAVRKPGIDLEENRFS